MSQDVPERIALSTQDRRSKAVGGAVIIAASCMPILGATSIAPIQPAMAAGFPDQPAAAVLVTLILTTPALIIGLTALIAGRVIDALGRKRVLVVSLFAYTVLGSAPLWLPDLPTILISRIGVGFAEAAIFAAGTAMIADLFTGQRRARYYGLQNVATGLSAVVFIAASGAIALGSWRASFWLYALALPLAVLAVIVLPAGISRDRQRSRLPKLDWRPLLRPVLFTLAGGIVFYAPVSMLAFRLSALGVHDTAVIGIASAIAALALALTAMLFPAVLLRRSGLLLPLAFGLLGAGLLIIGLSDTVVVVIVGAVIANAGGGFLLPTLQNWTVQRVEFAQRGRAAGAWTGAAFIGQFLCPLLVLGVAAQAGLGVALAAVGVLGLAMAVVSRLAAPVRPNIEEVEPAAVPVAE